MSATATGRPKNHRATPRPSPSATASPERTATPTPTATRDDDSGGGSGRSGDDSPAPSKAQLARQVAAVLPGPDDLGSDLPLQDRDSGLNAPTNDICGRDWSTEDDRLVREQRFYWADTSALPDVVVSVEAVGYEHGRATAAVRQVDEAVSSCAKWDYDGGVMTAITPGHPPAAALPGSFAWTAQDARANVTYFYGSVVQRRGDVMVAIYVRTKKQSALAGVTDAVTKVVSGKLAQVD